MASSNQNTESLLVLQRVEANAEKVGKKSANLKELEGLLPTINASTPAKTSTSTKASTSTTAEAFKVEVPAYFAIEHESVWDYLKFSTIDTPSALEKLWQRFVESVEKAKKQAEEDAKKSAEQGELKDKKEEVGLGKKKKADVELLTPEGRAILKEIRSLILTICSDPSRTFGKTNSAFSTFLSGLKPGEVLMVRSTGREDAVDFANPGGNESVAAVEPRPEAISRAMGIVVASYFSEKSIGQRLTSKKEREKITENPFIPVLIQKMVGENLRKEKQGDIDKNKDPDNVLRSGVIHTSDIAIEIEAAPGHGELVVDSKGAVDYYYVSNEDVVHEQCNVKQYRLVPMEVTKKRKLDFVKNPTGLAFASTLPPTIAQQIARVARDVHAHYRVAMDLEFVYEPKRNILHLVQARPISKQSAEQEESPSSIPPEKMADFKKLEEEHAIDVERGIVVASVGKAARIITQAKELIVANTLEGALAQYLGPPKNNFVKAVIVQEIRSSQFSHITTLFNESNIPILQIKNKNKIAKWMAEPNPALMIDPQRKQVIRWTSHLQPHLKVPYHSEEAKAILVTQGFLREGRFKSPISIREKAAQYDFAKYREARAKSGMVASQSKGREKEARMKLGALIAKAGDPKIPVEQGIPAFNQLMHELFKRLKPLNIKAPGLWKTQNFRAIIEKIELALPGETKLAEEALNNLMIIFARRAKPLYDRLYKKGLSIDAPEFRMFRTAMITCAEILYWLDRAKTMNRTSKEWSQVQDELQQLAGTLENLIYDRGFYGVISDSIFQSLQEEKDAKEAKDALEKKEIKLDEESLADFVQLFKFRKLGLNQRISKAWVSFILTACQEKDALKKIKNLVKFSMDNAIGSEFLNDCFAKQLGAKVDTIEQQRMHEIMQGLENEVAQTGAELEAMQFPKKQAIVNKWKQRIGAWASYQDPDSFENLFYEFNNDVGSLIDQVTVTSDMKPVTKDIVLKFVLQMTDMIDETIKSLKGSNEYEIQGKSQEQVQRFTRLLEIYHKLMEKWVHLIPDKKILEWTKDYADRLIDAVQDESQSRRAKRLRKAILAIILNKFKELKPKYDREQMQPSMAFSASSARIDSGANLLRQITGDIFDRAFFGSHDPFAQYRKSITKEDLFTLIHQNIYASVLAIAQEEPIKIEALPEGIQPFIQGLIKIAGVELMSMQQDYPKLILDFNKTLGNHSAKFIVEFDVTTHAVLMQYKFFGVGNLRMQQVAQEAVVESRLLNTQLLDIPQYSPRTMSLEYQLEFNLKDMTNLDCIPIAIVEYCSILHRQPNDPKALAGIIIKKYYEAPDGKIDVAKATEALLKVTDLLSLHDILRLDLPATVLEKVVLQKLSNKLQPQERSLTKELEKYFEKLFLSDPEKYANLSIHGVPLLHWAMINDLKGLTQTLIQYNVQALYEKGQFSDNADPITPIQYAMQTGNWALVVTILDNIESASKKEKKHGKENQYLREQVVSPRDKISRPLVEEIFHQLIRARYVPNFEALLEKLIKIGSLDFHRVMNELIEQGYKKQDDTILNRLYGDMTRFIFKDHVRGQNFLRSLLSHAPGEYAWKVINNLIIDEGDKLHLLEDAEYCTFLINLAVKNGNSALANYLFYNGNFKQAGLAEETLDYLKQLGPQRFAINNDYVKALNEGQLDKVYSLAKQGADIKVKNRKQRLGLELALESCNYEAIRFFVEEMEKIHKQGGESYQEWFKRISHAIKKYIAARDDADKRNPDIDFEIIKYLVGKITEVSPSLDKSAESPKLTESPLKWLIYQGNKKVLQFLLDQKLLQIHEEELIYLFGHKDDKGKDVALLYELFQMIMPEYIQQHLEDFQGKEPPYNLIQLGYEGNETWLKWVNEYLESVGIKKRKEPEEPEPKLLLKQYQGGSGQNAGNGSDAGTKRNLNEEVKEVGEQEPEWSEGEEEEDFEYSEDEREDERESERESEREEEREDERESEREGGKKNDGTRPPRRLR